MPSGRPCAAEAPRGLADKPPCSRSRLHTTQLRRGSRLGSSSPLFGERPLLGTVGLSTTPTSVLGEPGHPSSETGGQNWILKMRHTEFCRKGQLCGGQGAGQQEDAHHQTHPGCPVGRGLPSGGSPRQLLHPLGCGWVPHPHPGSSRCRPGAMLPLLPKANPSLKDQCGHLTWISPVPSTSVTILKLF